MFEDLKEIICEYVDVAPETIKEDSRSVSYTHLTLPTKA